MDFPPRTASHWTDEAMVPRAEFDAVVACYAQFAGLQLVDGSRAD